MSIAAKKGSEAKAMKAYRQFLNPDRELINDDCEVSQYLKSVSFNDCYLPPEVNHICGRGHSEHHEWFCNLILVSSAAHRWGHDKSPNEFELACLFAKFKKHQKWSDTDKLFLIDSKSDWNPDAMDGLVKNSNSLAGRISMLMDRVGKCEFWDFGLEMLESIEGSDIGF